MGKNKLKMEYLKGTMRLQKDQQTEKPRVSDYPRVAWCRYEIGHTKGPLYYLMYWWVLVNISPYQPARRNKLVLPVLCMFMWVQSLLSLWVPTEGVLRVPLCAITRAGGSFCSPEQQQASSQTPAGETARVQTQGICLPLPVCNLSFLKMNFNLNSIFSSWNWKLFILW